MMPGSSYQVTRRIAAHNHMSNLETVHNQQTTVDPREPSPAAAAPTRVAVAV